MYIALILSSSLLLLFLSSVYKKCKERGLSLPESVTDPTGAEQEPEDDVEEEQKGSKVWKLKVLDTDLLCQNVLGL